MADKRIVNWWESQYDAQQIAANRWQFQIAKAVSTSSVIGASNVIWQSQSLAPTVSVQWLVDYALGWTATLPSSGATVVLQGNWQPCAKGEVYDINELGYWTKSQQAPKPGWLKVGQVNYKYPELSGIHIVVGVKNANSGRYEIVFVDTVFLPPGSTATYQPQENVIWWLSGGQMTGQVYSSTGTSVGGADMSSKTPDTDKYEWWTTYTINDGKWANSSTSPSQAFIGPPHSDSLTPPPPTPEITLYPIIRWVLFGAAIGGLASQAPVRAFIFDGLATLFTNVVVTFTTANGNELRIEYGPPRAAPPGTQEAIGVLFDEDPNAPIEKVLRDALAEGVLEKGQTWTINEKPLPEGAGEGSAVPAITEA